MCFNLGKKGKSNLGSNPGFSVAAIGTRRQTRRSEVQDYVVPTGRWSWNFSDLDLESPMRENAVNGGSGLGKSFANGNYGNSMGENGSGGGESILSCGTKITLGKGKSRSRAGKKRERTALAGRKTKRDKTRGARSVRNANEAAVPRKNSRGNWKAAFASTAVDAFLF